MKAYLDNGDGDGVARRGERVNRHSGWGWHIHLYEAIQFIIPRDLSVFFLWVRVVRVCLNEATLTLTVNLNRLVVGPEYLYFSAEAGVRSSSCQCRGMLVGDGVVDGVGDE